MKTSRTFETTNTPNHAERAKQKIPFSFSRKVFLKTKPFLMCVFCSAFFAAVASAQVQSGQTKPKSSSIEFKKIRAQLLALSRDYSEIGRLLHRPGFERAGAEVAKVAQMPEEELSIFAADGSQLPAVVAATQSALDLLTANASTQSAMANAAHSPADDFPPAPYSDICGMVRTDTGALLALRVAYHVEIIAWSALSRGCDEVVVVAGEGGNTSLLCIAADAVLEAARAALEEVEFCDKDIDSAEINGNYLRADYIHNQVDTLTTKVDALAGEVEELRIQNCEIIRLLNTPEEERSSTIPSCFDQPGFPYHWGGR